jgi:hypothetical protein
MLLMENHCQMQTLEIKGFEIKGFIESLQILLRKKKY